MQEMVHTKHWKNNRAQDLLYLFPFEMMVESSPMWMGMLLLELREEKESLLDMIQFKAP